MVSIGEKIMNICNAVRQITNTTSKYSISGIIGEISNSSKSQVSALASIVQNSETPLKIYHHSETLRMCALSSCTNITTVDLLAVTRIREGAFSDCTGLTTLIIRTSSVCELTEKTAFTGTPIESGTGYIYVPRTLLEDYKAAKNWSVYSDQFRAIEDMTE